MDIAKGVVAFIGAIVVITILAVAAWQLDWFVEGKNVDRRTQVSNNSLNRQQALTSKVGRDIDTVRDIDTQEQTEAVIAQRESIVDTICENAGLLTGSVTLSASAERFIQQECPA